MGARWLHRVNDEAQSNDSTTFREKLPTSGKLHTIMLAVSCTTGATNGQGVSILDVIDEVRIRRNGSKIIWSLSSVELEKWIERLSGKLPWAIEDYGAGVVQKMVFPIMFGDSIYDPNHFMPLDRHDSLILEVDYSPNIAATAGYATGTVTFDITMLVTPQNEPLDYQGTYLIRRIYDFTSLASGDDKTDLPSEYPLKAIGVYAYEAGIEDGTNITKIVLKDDDSGDEVADLDWDNFLELNQLAVGKQATRFIKIFNTDNDTVNARMGHIVDVSLESVQTPVAATDIFAVSLVDAVAGDQLTLACAQAAIVAGSETLTDDATDRAYYLAVTGSIPSFFGILDLSEVSGSRGYLLASDYGRLKLFMTQDNAGAEVKVSVQELATF